MGHNLRVQSTGITTTRKPKALRVQYCRHPALFPLSFSDDSEFRLFTTTEATTKQTKKSEEKKGLSRRRYPYGYDSTSGCGTLRGTRHVPTKGESDSLSCGVDDGV